MWATYTSITSPINWPYSKPIPGPRRTNGRATSPQRRALPCLLVMLFDPVLVLVLQLIHGPRGLHSGVALVAGVAEAELQDAAAPAVPAIIPCAVRLLVRQHAVDPARVDEIWPAS